MSETKAIGLTQERAIYQVRCIEMCCTSAIGSPSCDCMYLLLYMYPSRVRDAFAFLRRLLPNQPMMNQEGNRCVHECVGARVCESEDGERGKIRTEV